MQSYQQTKRRKKRVLQAQMFKSVTVVRGKGGYGFTISGQNPCMLSCIIPSSPAHAAGLKAGDLLYFVNGLNVSRASHDDVVRMVGLSTGSLDLQVAENYNSSDSSDDDYLPRTKSRYPNRVRPRQSLGERGTSHDKASSSWSTVKQSSCESLKQYHPPEEESDLSSSLTSQEDQVWLNPATVAWRGFCQNRPETTGLCGEAKRQKNEMVGVNTCNKPVVSTARKISSAAAVVKRVPPVCDSIKHIQQGILKQKISENAQKDILSKLEPSSAAGQGDSEVIEGCNKYSKVNENVKAIVGYVGSIETPNSHRHPHQRLQALRNAVKRLRLEKKVHILVLMEVKPSGVLLTNAMGKQLALYPSDRIVFSGICSDDERFFGLVTQSVPDQDNDSCQEGRECSNSTCHIFKIDPDINAHSAHMQHAQAFQVSCGTSPQSRQCTLFPRSATSLAFCIASLYRGKPSRKFDSDIVQSQAFADPGRELEHCNSQGSGNDELPLEQNEQVCVVDMTSGRDLSDTSVLSNAMNTSLISMQNHLSPEMDVGGAGGTSSPCLSYSNSSEECWQQVLKPNNKLTPQAMPSPACVEVCKASCSQFGSAVKDAENLKQNMQRFLQARHQLLEEQNRMLGSDGESYFGENVLSLSVSEDGHAVLERGGDGCWQPKNAFAVPKNPPPVSVHHMRGRSAFHALRPSSAPLGKHSKPETVELDAVRKLNFPHNIPSSFAFARSPSAPPAPFFPHRDSDEEEDDVSDNENDPYIHQILEQFDKDRMAAMNDDSRRFSDGFAIPKRKDAVASASVEKWTKTGSFRRGDKVSLKQSFCHSMESLPNGENGENTATHKMMTACSVHSIAAANQQNQENVSKAGRVASWAVQFDKLLQDPLAVKVFTEFLEKEFSAENIRFWKACEQFRSVTSEQQRKILAKDIYNRHIAARASDPVNVDNTARSYTERFLETPTAIMFDVPQSQILQLMRQDSYPRFLKSDQYKNMLVEELEGNIHHEPEKTSENKGDQKQNYGKENGVKRRRSILPWKQSQKSVKMSCEGEQKKMSKKGKEGSHNQLGVGLPSQGTTSTATTTTGNKNNNNNNLANVKKYTGLNVDLSIMRKEVFQQKEVVGGPESQVKFCRVILPDGSTTVVCAKPGQTSRSVLSKLCEKRSISISNVDVFLVGTDKAVDLNDDISTLGSKEIVIERRVLFRLDLPDGKSVAAKAKPNRSIRDVLKPILTKYGYSLENISMNVTSCQELIGMEMPVTKLDNQRVVLAVEPEAAGLQKHKGPLFGLFRTSEKRVVDRRSYAGQGDIFKD
ncbi:unnamed protein product [Candidula unifasciata]|uniref:Regulator of G-protein signaling 12 n=1 Tax=Candidula unifasciata TaxID=100452 RepID=A0A8S3ZN95_9EUPU|nr:unnamed protein product [Candidula unifasciata]